MDEMKEKLLDGLFIEHKQAKDTFWYERTNPSLRIVEEEKNRSLSLYTTFHDSLYALGAPLPECVATFFTLEEIESWNKKQQEEIDFLRSITNVITQTLEKQMKLTGISHHDLPYLTLQGEHFLYYKIERNLKKGGTEVRLTLGYKEVTCDTKQAKQQAKKLAITMANAHRLRQLFKK